MKKKIAIVGMASRMPGGGEALWRNLLEGVDLVSQVAADRWEHEAFLHPNNTHAGTSYTFSAGCVGDVGGFDHGFFRISPREAALMDPQQRLLLEMAWEAIEHAGVKASSMRGSRCGVFIGISSADYTQRFSEDLAVIDASVATGNTSSIAANRISYVFDLRGPSMAIDTACSSALVAFHQACQSILVGETTMALVGGVSLHLHPYGYIIFSKASMLSPRGRCNVFDASGDGYVRSEGGGIFFLKDYDLAVADGDRVLAVVEATAVNTDGRKSGLTVPSSEAQAALLREAYEKAAIDPSEIDYIEAHGTGTAVGDPIETYSLGLALGQKRAAGQPLLIGSVKSNLGHLEPASGVAGLIKALYVLQHRLVPATIGIRELNPKIRFDEWNLLVAQENTPLKSEGRLVVGVNSFGFGGANAHAVLTSPPPSSSPSPLALSVPPLVVAGRSEGAARAMAMQLLEVLEGGCSPYALAYQQIFRRDLHSVRAVAMPLDTADAVAQLRSYAETGKFEERGVTGVALSAARGPIFVYSGNGSQWEGMGKLLLEDSVFSRAVDDVDSHFRPLAGFSLRSELLGENGEGRYTFTEIAQPALFALQVGVTEMLRVRGVAPLAVVGHSVGEVAAAWAAGALSLPQAVRVIFERSAQQGKTRGLGQMTAVACSEEIIQGLLKDADLSEHLAVAGINSPRGVTLAGGPEDLGQIEQLLTGARINFKRLDLEYAFHSAAMDSIEAGVHAALIDLAPSECSIPFYSTVAGCLLDGKQLDAAYWWQNIRQPVMFGAAVEQLLKEQGNVFVEVGPHAVLRGYLNDCLRAQNVEGRVVATVTRGNDEPQRILDAWAQLVIAGVPVDWAEIFPVPAPHVDLPPYPWQREHHWHGTTSESLGLLSRTKVHPLLGHLLAQHVLTWENQIDTVLHPELGDHVVGEAVLFPGTGFVELALAAAQEWHDSTAVEVRDLEIRVPLVLSDEFSKSVRSAIDDTDGTLRISGRQYVGNEAWAIHAVGRIIGEVHPALFSDAPLRCLPPDMPDFDALEHLRLTRLAGLQYGEAFQAVDFGWRRGDEVFGRLRLPAAVEKNLAAYKMHPALLDCTFQLIIHLLADQVEKMPGVAFVPTRIGRLVARSGSLRPHTVSACLRRRSPHSLTVDFQWFDEEGMLLARIEEARFRSVRLQRHHADHVRQLVEVSLPQPHARSATEAPAASFEQVAAALREAFHGRDCLAPSRRYAEQVEPLLDTLSGLFVRQSLQGDEGGQLAAKLPQRILQSQEVSSTEVHSQDVWNSLFADYPDFFPILRELGRQGLHLKERLLAVQSESTTEDLPGWPELVHTILGAPGRHALSQALSQATHAAILELAPGERFRMIEVVSGLTPLAADLCPEFDFDYCDYWLLADAISMPACEELQERFPRLRVVSRAEFAEQEESLPQMHFALLTSGFGYQPVTEPLMRAIRDLLAPRGVLAMLGVCPSYWMDFIYSANAVWWSAAENDGQRHPLLLAPEWWRQHADFLGFSDTQLLRPVSELSAGAYMLLAQVGDLPAELEPPQVLPEGRWLFLTGGMQTANTLGDQLAPRLQALGVQVACLQDISPSSLQCAVEQVSDTPLAGVVLLAGLAGEQTAAERCAQAAELFQVCERQQIATTLWVLVAPAAHSLNDAALKGFARTLINEAAGLSVRIIDLGDGVLGSRGLDALAQELLAPSDELEVSLDSEGRRSVPRLRDDRYAMLSEQASDAGNCTYLGFHFPGQLRNLCWMSEPGKQPKGNEVRIDVSATGLNFRDVMYALGLLSDEAVEDGFAGPTLGLECAGVVSAIGAGVKGLAVGDRVVAFGPSCFANRIVTQADAVAPIPGDISFEAAATIPSTFLTAYYALYYLAKLGEGERVLIHGAAGGVGIAAIQIAKWCGAEIFATAGSDEKRDFLQLLGADHVFDSRSLNFADDILLATRGEGVDVVLNSLAGEAINRNFQILRPFGRFLELGKRDFYENTKLGLRPFRNNISYFGIDADQLMAEKPGLTRKLFTEVMALFSQGVLHPLPFTAFEANDVVDAFRHMQQARQIGKIVVTYYNGIRQDQSSVVNRESLNLQEDATYLVTGGLRGFGLRTARWLAEKGARHLILLSRSGPVDPEAQPVLVELRAAGVKVLAEACDVTNFDAMQSLLARAKHEGMPTLKGLVHAAMVIDDGLVRSLDRERIGKVLWPKLQGARVLHDLTKEMPLDFFVLFSSATTCFGNPGQASYVAANTWLEHFSRMRRAQGLPSLAVAWGAIDDAGFLARNAEIKEALQGRMGGVALKSEVALGHLEQLLLQGRDGVAVLDLEWRALSRFLPSAGSPRFQELSMAGEDSVSQDGAEDVARMLQEMCDTELHAAFIAMLKEEVAEILRMDPDKLDEERSIYDMGLDSLMGVELVTALETRFGVRLPVMALSESPSLVRLADKLVSQLRGENRGMTDQTDQAQSLEAKVQQLVGQHDLDVSADAVAEFVKDMQHDPGSAAGRLIH